MGERNSAKGRGEVIKEEREETEEVIIKEGIMGKNRKLWEST